MGYSQVALENKLLDMYPAITQKRFKPMMSFDQGKDSWAVRLKNGNREFTVSLNKKDVDACIDGNFLRRFRDRDNKAAGEMRRSLRLEMNTYS
jgi:roadblock/LC7 domain-containing protein